MKTRRATAVLFVSACILAILGGVYLISGLNTLTTPGLNGDLTMRWRELQLVLDGINPYDVSAMALGKTPSISEIERLKGLNASTIEPVMSSGYPPWAFLTGMLFVWPGDFRITQYVFAALNVSALGLVLIWVYLIGRPYGTIAGFFLSAGAFAVFGNASTLRLGQYGIICNALLVLMLLAEERRKEIPAGLAFALAAMKPNLSWLYFIILVVRQRKIAVATAAAYIIAASLLVGYFVHTSPVEMVLQMFGQSPVVFKGGIGPLNVLLDYQLPYSVLVIAFGVSGLIAALLLITYRRHASTLTLFSIAAVLGRLAVYHRQYDNVMLVFPLVALGLQMLEKPQIWRISSFLIFGCSLWIPLRYADYTHAVQLSLAAIWLSGLCIILVSSPQSEV